MLFRLSDIRKSYGGTEVLRGVSFQVNPGEKIGLVGRNGAGKTTVFRVILGEETADSGDVVRMTGLKIGLLEQHVDFDTGDTVHTAALSAFKEIHDIEAEMRRIESVMVTDHSQTVLDQYAELQTAYEHADGFTYATRAEAVLLGLGFSRDTWLQDTVTLSGGQKNRLGMARLLLSNADVLLLDEPTNHLDVHAVEWLEGFLTEYDKPYVIISHDRYFLDRTATRIIEIENGKAVNYKGNYSTFVVERELRREQQQREYENQQALISKTQEFIRRNLEGQKTKQAKSRRNMLERLDRIESVATEKSGGNFGLRKVERAGNNVLTVEGLSIGYGSRILASGIDLSLHRGEALGIIGGNGTGKTTFLKTVMGELRGLGGEVHWGTRTDIGYYTQNLQDLEARNEVIQELRRVAPLAESGDLRGFLARFLFFGDDVFKHVSELSGGEKGRLALAKLIYSRKNVLILDEPTNHLDIPAREALEDALDEYDGTIITVSHDRFFLDKIATQIMSFGDNGSVEIYSGNYSQYHDWAAGRHLSSEGYKNTASSERSDAANFDSGLASSLSKNQHERIEKRISEIESEITAIETRNEELTHEMSSPETAASFERLSPLTEELRRAQERVAALYEEWEHLAEKLA